MVPVIHEKADPVNDLLKFLSKTLHPFGYHIRPRTGKTFLKVAALEQPENEGSITAVRQAMQSTIAAAPEGRLDRLHIILRTCLRERRNANPKPRLTGEDTFENGYRCIRSLIRSINAAQEKMPEFEITLDVLDDRSDAKAQDVIRSLLKDCKVHAGFSITHQTGQGASLHEAFSLGRTKDALVYCVEDDYLHERDGIYRLARFYQSMAREGNTHMMLYPQEHERIYKEHYPSYIVCGEDGHWRSMRHATHTFLTHGKMIDRYWSFFENTKYVGNKKRRKQGSEARTTDRLFGKIPGFSPLKPCAVHLQYEELLPPFYDWRPLWEENAA